MKKGILLAFVYLMTGFVYAETAAKPNSELLVIPPQNIEGESAIIAESADSLDADIIKASQNIAGVKSVEEQSEKNESLKSTNAKESEIPLFQSTKGTEQKPEMSSVSRLAFSFAVVLLAGIGALFFGRWWGKRNSRNEINTQMRLMSQFHIGPKKTLAIVRVAGEFILLGVTENNINMIKTLSLIDDEYPENNKGFQETLSEKTDTDDKDDFVLGSIKDVVGKKLKDFRTL